jgi:hypothetical protein
MQMNATDSQIDVIGYFLYSVNLWQVVLRRSHASSERENVQSPRYEMQTNATDS